MRTSQYSTAALIDLFRQQTVATLAEVMTALGTGARRTAFRKLKEIPYRASYSHRGRYYTLDELIDFERATRAGVVPRCTLLGRRQPAQSPPPQRWSAMRGQDSSAPRSWTGPAVTSAPRMPCASWFSSSQADGCQKLAGQFLDCAADRTLKAQQMSARRALAGRPRVGRTDRLGCGPRGSKNCAPLSCCSPACSTNASASSYAGLESLKCIAARGDTRIAVGYSVSTPVPWPGLVGNCSLRTSNASACAAPMAGGQR